MAKKSGYSVVPIDPVTKKELKQVYARQPVKYALKGPRGGLKPFQNIDTQLFNKKDLLSFNREVNKNGKNFTLFEQYTKQVRRDKNGNKLYLKNVWDDETRKKSLVETPDHYFKKGGKTYLRTWNQRKKQFELKPARKDAPKNKPLYTIKLAAPTSTKKQRPVLYVNGKYARKESFFFEERKKRDIKALKLTTIVQPGTRFEQTLKGETIKAAISNIKLPITENDLREGRTIFWNAALKVFTPSGETIKIPRVGTEKLYPGASATIEGADSAPSLEYLRAEKLAVMGDNIPTLAKMHQSIGRTLKLALLDNGYTFTSLLKLEELANEVAVESPGTADLISEAIDKNAKELQPNHRVELNIAFDIQEF